MHDVNPLCIAAQSSRFTSSHQVVGRRTESDWTANGIRSGGGRNPIGRRTESDRTADGIRSGGGRNPIGRRTESDRTADGIRQGVQLSQLHQQSRQAHSLGWRTYCSVGALETSAPPERHQHLCRSVKSVGLILSKSEFRGAAGRGCTCLKCTNQANGESIPTEYAEHTEPSGGDVPPTDRHRCAQIWKVWHPCHTHAINRAND